MFSRIITICSIILLAGSCKPTQPKPEIPEGEGTYFSIKQFVKDQWDTYSGQPFGLKKIVHLNGKVDSTMVSAYDMEWGSIFKVFFESDISDKKFLGKYDFTTFEDDITITRSFYYEANDPKLFTRKLQINVDPYNNKIKSIYIETQKNSSWNTRSQKLFYAPLKVISIQELETSNPGPSKDLRIEYQFL